MIFRRAVHKMLKLFVY